MFDIKHYSIMQTNILTGLPQKSHPLLDTRSVPPAVAGGCAAVWRRAEKLTHPPATAGGTDRVQQKTSDLRQGLSRCL